MTCPFINKQVLDQISEEQKKSFHKVYDQCPIAASEPPQTQFDKLFSPDEESNHQIARPLTESKPSQGHTDPSNDYFEEGFLIKFKPKYSQFMNFRKLVQAKPQEEEMKNAISDLIEEQEEEETAEESFTRISMKELKKKQERLRSYPPIVLHTLFHNHKNYEKYRKVEFSNLYFFSDDVKAKGNKKYQKNFYYAALDYYEQCLSLFNWLELKDQDHKDNGLKLFSRNQVQLEDDLVINRLKDIEDCKDELLEQENCQATYFNKNASFTEIEYAIQQVNSGFTYIQTEQQKQILIKMNEMLQIKQKAKVKSEVFEIQDLIKRAKKIYDYKTLNKIDIDENNTSAIESAKSKFKIVQKMHVKYFDIIEYFRESDKQKEIKLTIEEFQKFDETFQNIKFLFDLNLKTLDFGVQKEIEVELKELIKTNEVILSIIENLRMRKIEDKFQSSKHMNIEVLKYAMEICDKEEKKQEKLKQKELLKEKSEQKSNLKSTLLNLLFFTMFMTLWIYYRDQIYSFILPSRNKFS